ncbi:hypothetical protein FACS189499_01620 [Clostridia bacterium]|nr:hypothetical protein FACS189499_01620 [Clostridia bacterium]
MTININPVPFEEYQSLRTASTGYGTGEFADELTRALSGGETGQTGPALVKLRELGIVDEGPEMDALEAELFAALGNAYGTLNDEQRMQVYTKFREMIDVQKFEMDTDRRTVADYLTDIIGGMSITHASQIWGQVNTNAPAEAIFQKVGVAGAGAGAGAVADSLRYAYLGEPDDTIPPPEPPEGVWVDLLTGQTTEPDSTKPTDVPVEEDLTGEPVPENAETANPDSTETSTPGGPNGAEADTSKETTGYILSQAEIQQRANYIFSAVERLAGELIAEAINDREIFLEDYYREIMMGTVPTKAGSANSNTGTISAYDAYYGGGQYVQYEEPNQYPGSAYAQYYYNSPASTGGTATGVYDPAASLAAFRAASTGVSVSPETMAELNALLATQSVAETEKVETTILKLDDDAAAEAGLLNAFNLAGSFGGGEISDFVLGKLRDAGGSAMADKLNAQLADALTAKFTENGKGISTFQLQLEPENLGKLTIQLTADSAKAGEVSIKIFAESADAALLLQSRAEHLAAILRENGIIANAYDVNVKQPTLAEAAAAQQQQNEQQQQQQQQNRRQPYIADVPDLEADEDPVTVSFTDVLSAAY